jgi:hypothetical protein
MIMRTATTKRCRQGWLKLYLKERLCLLRKNHVKGYIFFNAVKNAKSEIISSKCNNYHLPAMNSDRTLLTKLLFRFVHLLTML